MLSPSSLTTFCITPLTVDTETMSSPTHDVEDGQVLAHEKETLEINGNEKASTQALKLDKHGLPLVPQPSDHKDDPLVSRNS